MTDLLYYADAYTHSFQAIVRQVEHDDKGVRLVLDRTAFYPGGGGQPNDQGWLDVEGERRQVSRVFKEAGQIWHLLTPTSESSALATAQPNQEQTVQGALDWERRYALMRTHTAMHILCGVVWRDYGASVTGGNMEPGKGRMDFEFASMSGDLVSDIEAKCNAEIKAAREIRVQSLARAEAFQIPDLIRTKINLLPADISEVRTVELVGLDLQADGGTHVGNTREVGAIRVVDYRSKGAINKRIYVEIDG